MNKQLTHAQVEARLKVLISEITGYDETLLTLETKLTPDEDTEKALNVGSLELAELLISIDEEFEVNIPDQKTSELNTLGSLVTYILENKK